MADSRGMRNNNPLNIRRDRRNRWMGMAATQTDAKFVQFATLRMGYRAAFVLLRNYMDKGVNTIGRIIRRWAPAADNNATQGYIDFVARHTGTEADEPLRFDQEQRMVDMVCAMAQMETGVVADRHIVEQGYLLALEAGKEETRK